MQKNKILLISLMTVVICLALSAYFVMGQDSEIVTPIAENTSPKSEPAPLASETIIIHQAEGVKPQEKVELVQSTLSTANMAKITALQNEKEELKLQVEIKDLKDKLTVTPVTQPTITLPPIDFPPDFIAQAPVKRSRLVAITNFSGEIVAKVQGSNGLITLKKGDKFEGGTVKSITSNTIEIVRNGKTESMRIE